MKLLKSRAKKVSRLHNNSSTPLSMATTLHDIDRPIADVAFIQRVLSGRIPLEIRCGSNGITPKVKNTLKPAKMEHTTIATTSKLLSVSNNSI